MAAIDDKITALQATVANLATVEKSAVALLNGISGQIKAAVDAALAAGATPAELQSLTDLNAAIVGDTAELATAVAANTATPKPTA